MTLLTRLPLAALALALVPAPVVAQAPAAAPAAAANQLPAKVMAQGIGIANVQAIVNSSKAFKNANSERQIVYKDQYAMAERRRQQINAEITPLVTKFNADRDGGKVAQAELQAQLQVIQNLQNAGVQELQNLLAPMSLSEAYVSEQIGDAINKAIVSAMDKRGITLVVPPGNLLAFNNGYDISGNVLAELDAMLPVAKVAPPAGWLPRAQREAQAAQQAALNQPARPTPAAPASRRGM